MSSAAIRLLNNAQTNSNIGFVKPLSFSVAIVFLTLAGCSSKAVFTSGKTGQPSTQAYSSSTFGLYDITSFDIYMKDDVVHILMSGKTNAQDKKSKLRYSRSEDGGQTWTDPVSLEGLPATIANRGNDVQLAADGNHLLAVWQTAGELPGMGPMVSAYSDDNGLTWKAGANPAVNRAGDQSHIDILADLKGNFHVVWLEDPEENGYQSLRYARTQDGEKSWSKVETLDGSTCSCCWNTLALSPNGGLNLLYRDMKPRDMSLLQSADDGQAWDRAGLVGEFGWQFDGCPHVGGSLVHGGGDHPGQLFSLVWTGLEDKAGLYFLASQDDGKTWSTPKRIGDSAIHGDISASQEKITALWDEMEPDGSSIFFAQSTIEKQPEFKPVRLTQPVLSATHPRLAATTYGFLAIWTEKPKKQPSRLAWQLIK